MNEPVFDCVWKSLETDHRHLGQFAQRARRYELSIAPFAAVEKPDAEALSDLATLMTAGEFAYLFETDCELSPLFHMDFKGRGLQMVATRALDPAPNDFDYERLTTEHVPEMLDLIAIAFPGYFRKRTIEMGRYFGVRDNGVLIAMAGERMAPAGNREVSSVCTHPEYRGRGHAENLMRVVCDGIQKEHRRPILHVGTRNTRAIGIYERLGFVVSREIGLWGLTRA